MTGKLITFEGIEGSGKTTQLKLVAAYLARKGVALTVTQEPGGTDIGRRIGEILFSRRHHHLMAETELLLFCAARAQHVRDVILPALKRNQLVLCDRFSDATYAYQGFGRGLDLAVIKRMNDFAAMSLKPGKTLLFDLPVEVGLRRATGRNHRQGLSDQDRFEREHQDFHRRIREGYLELSRREPGRFCVIDADRDVESIQKDVRDCLDRWIRVEK